MTAPTDLRHRFGDLDIYLFDQLLRGRIEPGLRIFDAGCGGGRNLVYFLREGYDVRGIDPNPEAIATVRALASQFIPDQADDRFAVASLEAHGVPPASADVVIVSAVLHFARDDAHFDAMVEGAWRILAPGGLFFSRLASSIGIEGAVRPLGRGRFRLPDGSDRYLVDEPRLMALTRQLDADLVDPLKTTVVQGQRAMTTWVLRRHGGHRPITVL